MGFPLPEYAYWSPAQWSAAGAEYDEIRDIGLGWDVTDFGSGDLARVGRTIFTLRNGRHGDGRYPKSYAQKVMCMPEGQMSILHHHRSKMEDIHNQGGGNIVITLWQVGADGGRSAEPLELSVAGVRRRIAPGQTVRLRPGEWICLPPRTWHCFGAESGGGMVLSVEVSSVCDDLTDNVFEFGAGCRFPAIVEDEPARYVLCREYRRPL